MKKISVIVPVYNVEKLLHKCINSILMQTYRNLEVILVDDGAIDSSGHICDEYASQDSRVVVIHKKNGGQASARNMALDIAKGDYIGFIDSDDYVSPNMYQILMDAIERNNADIAVCGRYNVEEKDGSLSTLFTTEQESVWDAKEALRRLLVFDAIDSAACDKIFAKRLFDDIRFPSGYICEDVAVIYKLLDKSSKVVQTGQPMYYYLQREGSTSRSMYTEKTKGLIHYHREAYKYCVGKYPEMRQEAEAFYFAGVYTLLNKYVLTDTWTDRSWLEREVSLCYRITKNNALINPEKRRRLWLLNNDLTKILLRKYRKTKYKI